MSSFVTGCSEYASAPETETNPKKLFVCENGPVHRKLPSLKLLERFFSRFGRVVKITSANNGKIAFVTFASSSEARVAMDAMDSRKVVAEFNGARFMTNLFVDYALENCTKKSAPRPEPVETQKLVLDIESVDLPIVYNCPEQIPKMMSNEAMAFLFDLGFSPQTKFQGDTNVQIFGNGIQWVIPHPDHPSATQECQREYDSGAYLTQFPVQIPREVFTSKKFWRD